MQLGGQPKMLLTQVHNMQLMLKQVSRFLEITEWWRRRFIPKLLPLGEACLRLQRCGDTKSTDAKNAHI